jgi:hypothetical protein
MFNMENTFAIIRHGTSHMINEKRLIMHPEQYSSVRESHCRGVMLLQMKISRSLKEREHRIHKQRACSRSHAAQRVGGAPALRRVVHCQGAQKEICSHADPNLLLPDNFFAARLFAPHAQYLRRRISRTIFPHFGHLIARFPSVPLRRER